MFKRLALYLNTIKYLKPSQIYFRLRPKKNISTSNLNYKLFKPDKEWKKFYLYEEKITKDQCSIFLNLKDKLDLPSDWNNKKHSDLWLYNLHYFDDLLSFNADEKRELHFKLIERWINENPPFFGIGWDSYPISLRIVNIYKYWLNGNNINDKISSSLIKQYLYLKANPELHLLGNHYFSNLKAIFFSEVVLGLEDKRLKTFELIMEQLEEQVLSDGMNFELSPMYHDLMLVDLLDIFNLIQSYNVDISDQYLGKLKEKILKMLNFSCNFRHGDNSLPHFNDVSDQVAPSYKILEAYAKTFGFKALKSSNEIEDYKESGYLKVDKNNKILLFDASSIGPSYIPGHGHADTLSFEFSHLNSLIIVNTGTSTYALSSRREFERSTSAHSTVEINDSNSSEIWSSFRVGNRAQITHRKYGHENEKVFLEAEHNGYKNILHRRKIILDTNDLIVEDKIIGAYSNAVSRFYFHPNVDLVIKNERLYGKVDDFSFSCNLQNLDSSLEEYFWAPGFNQQQKSKVLKCKVMGGSIRISFNWKN